MVFCVVDLCLMACTPRTHTPLRAWGAEYAGTRRSPYPQIRGGGPLCPATGSGGRTAGARSNI
eukprot:9902434-Alexandrium_andersonii.AAC.1